jgi:WD40 repeat protein
MAQDHDTTVVELIPELGTNNTCLQFSSDGMSLFVGTQSGQIQVWSILRRRCTRTLTGSPLPVRRLRQDAQGRLLVVGQWTEDLEGGFPCHIGVWTVAGWQPSRSWVIPGLDLEFAISPDGLRLATGHRYGPVQLRNLSGPSETNAVSLASGTVTDLAFSPDGCLLAASTQEGDVHVWEIPSLRQLPDTPAHHRPMWAIAFSPDGRRLATAGEGREALKLWDVATWEDLITLERQDETLEQLAFSADGNQIAAANSQGDLLCWRVPSVDVLEAREDLRSGP